MNEKGKGLDVFFLFSLLNKINHNNFFGRVFGTHIFKILELCLMFYLDGLSQDFVIINSRSLEIQLTN